jgi:hypothetical protein
VIRKGQASYRTPSAGATTTSLHQTNSNTPSTGTGSLNAIKFPAMAANDS